MTADYTRLASSNKRACGGISSLTAGMLGKTFGRTPVHRAAVGPRPAAKLGALVVKHGLADLSLRIHHKGAILRYGFIDRFALQQ